MKEQIQGVAPASDAGAAFSINVWRLTAILDWLRTSETAAPLVDKALTAEGLTAEEAATLGEFVEGEVEDGSAAAYKSDYEARIAALEWIECPVCKGTGGEEDDPCVSCGGEGKLRPNEANRPFDVADVEAFGAFAAASGGFSLHGG